MKKRIIALVLVVVMSLLALSSCASYNFATENYDSYASFDSASFVEALKNIEIEDGTFTADETTREKIVKSKIYAAVADKIIAEATKEDRIESGKLGAGDVLYFVYNAVDEKTGNVYYTSQMTASSITGTDKAKHVVKLGNLNETNEFLKLVLENLEKDVDIAEYAYKMLLKADIEAEAEKALKESNPDATADDIKAAKEAAIKVKEGDTIVVSFTRTYTKPAEEGQEKGETVTESAAYLTIDASNPLFAEILNAKVNNVATSLTDTKDYVEFAAPTEQDSNLTVKAVTITEGETEYSYSNIKVLWKVEQAGKAIATFKYTPSKTTLNVKPDNLGAGKEVDIKNVELTYYVYPAYAIAAPSYENITATDILTYISGSSVKVNSFDVFAEDSYVKDGKKISELAQELANIYDTKSDKYADGTNLKTLLDAYNKADSEDNNSPTAEQTAATAAAKAALEKAQKEAAAAVIANIVAASNGKSAGEAIVEEYYHDTYHTEKETYDSDIQKKVQKAVWNLIDKYVTVNEDAIPESLLKEFSKIVYEAYEYDYYTGKYGSSTTVTNYAQFSENGGLDAFLKYKLGDDIDAAIAKEAKAQIVPIVKIFVVSNFYAEAAEAAMPGYIEENKAVGDYEVDEQSYKDYYGEDKYEKYYKDALKSAEKEYEYDLKQASNFIVDDAYLRAYKRSVGAAAYRQDLKTYGKTNLRVAFQFDNLFHYLTATNRVESEDGDHAEVKYVTRDGANYLDFKNVTYTIKTK